MGKENPIDIEAMSESKAKRLTDENRHGAVWPAGLYIIVEDRRAVIETRAEADELISAIRAAADELWP